MNTADGLWSFHRNNCETVKITDTMFYKGDYKAGKDEAP